MNQMGKRTLCQRIYQIVFFKVAEIRWVGDSNEEENGTLLHSCLGNSMDRGAWWVTVHGAAKESDTASQLNNNKGDSKTKPGILFWYKR